MLTAELPDFCNASDHDAWGNMRRSTFLWIEMAIILCAVLLAQMLGGYGHAYAYMIGLAICSLAFQMMPHALGWYALGYSLSQPSLLWDGSTSLLKTGSYSTVLPIIAFQWLASAAAGLVVQASGTFIWFERILVRFYSGKASRMAMPVSCALLGVFSALACGTDAINLMYLLPIINASKITGLRPSKSISALVVGGLLGAACSPVNPASQYYYNRFASPTTLDGAMIVGYTLEPLMAYSHIAYCVVPAAVVGALAAGAVATFIGHDLEDSQTYKRRCQAGLVAQPGDDEAVAILAQLHDQKSGQSGAQNSQLQHPLDNQKLGKLEKEFSLRSRLEDGDYVYTHARFRDGTYVDINDRQENGGAPGRLNSGRKSVTINIQDKNDAAEEAAPLMKEQQLLQTGKAYTALGVMVAVGVATLVLAILKAAPKESGSTNRNTRFQTVLDKDSVIPDNYPLPTAYIFGVLALAAAGIIMLANKLKSWQLNHASLMRTAVPGILGMLAFSALGGSWIWEWRNRFNCVGISAQWSRDNPFTWIFWIFLLSVFSGNEAITQHRVVNYLSFHTDLNTRVRWLTSAFPMAIGSVLLPTNANMIVAAELDDTGSTNLGQYLFDHVFIIPGIVGAAAAFGVAYGISVGVFPL